MRVIVCDPGNGRRAYFNFGRQFPNPAPLRKQDLVKAKDKSHWFRRFCHKPIIAYYNTLDNMGVVVYDNTCRPCRADHTKTVRSCNMFSPHMESRLDALTERLTRYARRHATPTVTVDDLLQIAREEILKNCTPLDNDTYMLRLADWRMKNAIIKERAYAVRIADVEIDTDTDDDENEQSLVIRDVTNTPEDAVITQELYRKIREVDSRLTPEQRLILAYLADNLSQHEIARQMRTSQARIRYHILKIRSAFQMAGLTPAYILA
jgi:RNA polymerase sigma factor (sigma-70 family)